MCATKYLPSPGRSRWLRPASPRAKPLSGHSGDEELHLALSRCLLKVKPLSGHEGDEELHLALSRCLLKVKVSWWYRLGFLGGRGRNPRPSDNRKYYLLG